MKCESLINHKNTFESKGSKDKTIFSMKSEGLNNSDDVKSIGFKEIIINDESSSSNDKNDNSKNTNNNQIEDTIKSNNNSFKGNKNLFLISSLINEGVEAEEYNERVKNSKMEMEKSRSNIISMSSNQYVDYSLEFDNEDIKDIKVKKTIKSKLSKIKI